MQTTTVSRKNAAYSNIVGLAALFLALPFLLMPLGVDPQWFHPVYWWFAYIFNRVLMIVGFGALGIRAFLAAYVKKVVLQPDVYTSGMGDVAEMFLNFDKHILDWSMLFLLIVAGCVNLFLVFTF